MNLQHVIGVGCMVCAGFLAGFVFFIPRVVSNTAPPAFAFLGHKYSCADLVGPHPDASIAMIPPQWSARVMVVVDPQTGALVQRFDGLEDGRGVLICDRAGRDVRK